MYFRFVVFSTQIRKDGTSGRVFVDGYIDCITRIALWVANCRKLWGNIYHFSHRFLDRYQFHPVARNLDQWISCTSESSSCHWPRISCHNTNRGPFISVAKQKNILGQSHKMCYLYGIWDVKASSGIMMKESLTLTTEGRITMFLCSLHFHLPLQHTGATCQFLSSILCPAPAGKIWQSKTSVAWQPLV